MQSDNPERTKRSNLQRQKGDSAKLEAAIAAYREALKVLTSSNADMAQGNLQGARSYRILERFFSGEPAVVAGAGPSMSNGVPWLRRRDRSAPLQRVQPQIRHEQGPPYGLSLHLFRFDLELASAAR